MSCDSTEEDNSGTEFEVEENVSDLEAETCSLYSQQNIVQHTLKIVEWLGFKLVADNVDKNFHPYFHRYSDDYTNNSMHSFHIYAVQDRINFLSCSDINLK